MFIFSVLLRQDGDGVGIEEIDNLQTELESLLVEAMQRTRKYKIEIMTIENWNKQKGENFKLKVKLFIYKYCLEKIKMFICWS